MFGNKTSDDITLDDALNDVLFDWPDHPQYKFKVRQACEGIQIFGATGSGKSSGSGKHIAEAYLNYGYGGLVLCAKPSELDAWKGYAKATNREKDLVIFEPGVSYQFNPLEYEMDRDGVGANQTINMVHLIMSMHQIGKNFMAGGAGSANDERFWDDAVRRLIGRTIDLLKLAKKDVTFPNMREIVANSLTATEVNKYKDESYVINDPDESEENKDNSRRIIKKLRANNFSLNCLLLAFERKDLSAEEEEDYAMVQSYFTREFAKLSDRTKSIVQESFLGLVEPFGTGLLKKHFTSGLSEELMPERTYEEGAIIVLNFPAKEHMLSGVLAQAIYKFIWQQAQERRTFEDGNFRPTFLWIDESQFFVLPEYDTLFATSARSSLVSTVYLTQNINNYYFSMGENAQARTKSLMGNMATKIFHANTDIETNEFAAKTIGEDLRTMQSLNFDPEKDSGGTFSEQLMFQVLPKQFTILNTGGEEETGYKPEAIIIQNGKEFLDEKDVKRNYLKVGFEQR